jgi:hypothetical protein
MQCQGPTCRESIMVARTNLVKHYQKVCTQPAIVYTFCCKECHAIVLQSVHEIAVVKSACATSYEKNSAQVEVAAVADRLEVR